MNARARALGLRDTHFVRPDGLDAPGHVSSARDVAVLAQVAMHSPIVRDLVRLRSDTIEDGTFVVHTWNDLLGHFPGPHRRQDRAHERRGLVRGRGRAAFGLHDLCGDPRQPDARAAERRPERAARVGRLAIPHAAARRGAAVCVGGGAVRTALAVALVARKPLVRAVRVGRPIVEKIVAPTAVALPVERGERLGRIEVWTGGKLLGTRPLLAGRSVARPGLGGRLRWYSTRTVHNLLGLLS